ncbi:CopL family metal-binding regulatory protein [Cognatilysobacter segetis]|uniref:CopL family metal-binding regulatory protein n=1 Tax=Cognatilysobacter segetis TaxID=2492394 RepID=UPI0010611906|nr:CopL family metal-binding regulatory protein [Lysobacter segetis]
MNLVALLLRIVLCLALVANGAGAARASTHVACGHAGAPRDAAAAMHGHAHDCCDPDAMPRHHDASDGHATPHSSSHPSSSEDGCDRGGCACPCPAQLPIGMAPVGEGRIAARSPPSRLLPRANHAPPRLPPLIRPPIG